MRLRLMALAACIVSAVPAAAEGPDIGGLWRFDMVSPQGITTLGAMTVRKNNVSGIYEGRLITNGGVEGLPIRSLQIAAGRMTLEVQSAHGPIVFRGDVNPSGQSFSGTLRYHDGRDFSMSGVKQVPLPSRSPPANP